MLLSILNKGIYFNKKEICDKWALNQLISRGYFEDKEFRQREWASKYYKDLIEEYLEKQNTR